jgi:hypothetical protein
VEQLVLVLQEMAVRSVVSVPRNGDVTVPVPVAVAVASRVVMVVHNLAMTGTGHMNGTELADIQVLQHQQAQVLLLQTTWLGSMETVSSWYRS